MNLPEVKLRELKLEDAADRYKWCLDKEVTRYLNVPDTFPPFTMEETENWIQKCIDKTNDYEQKAILSGDGKHIGWVDLKKISIHSISKPNWELLLEIRIFGEKDMELQR